MKKSTKDLILAGLLTGAALGAGYAITAAVLHNVSGGALGLYSVSGSGGVYTLRGSDYRSVGRRNLF